MRFSKGIYLTFAVLLFLVVVVWVAYFMIQVNNDRLQSCQSCYFDNVDHIYIGIEDRPSGGYNLWIHQLDKDNHQLGYAFCITTGEIEEAIEEYEANKIEPNQ